MPQLFEYVLCRAIWYDDKKEHVFQPSNLSTGIVLCGFAYEHISGQFPIVLHDLAPASQTRGWMTSHNRFLTDTEDIYKVGDPPIGVDTTQEYLLCAATWFSDKKIYRWQPQNISHGVVLCGWKHPCIIQQIGGLVSERHAKGIYEQESGFLTSMHRFVDREEGVEIAYAVGQIHILKKKLYSEDLYGRPRT